MHSPLKHHHVHVADTVVYDYASLKHHLVFLLTGI